MSHALGEVICDGRVVGYYEYDGTSDRVITRIRDSERGVRKHWRSGEQGECVCGQPPTPVLVYSSYGNGFWWHGEACLACKAILGPISPWEREEPMDGHPLRGEEQA